MKTASKIFVSIDRLLLALYVSLVVFGWCNMYAVSYEEELGLSLFTLSSNAGRQLVWIIATFLIFFLIFCLDGKLYQALAYFFYTLVVFLLLCTLLWGVSIGGHKAWLQWGGQPSELAKCACAMAIAKYLDEGKVQLKRLKPQLILLGIILLPLVLILLQGDLGTGLVFLAFFIVFYREGLSPWLFWIGMYGVTISVLTLLVPQTYLLICTLGLGCILIGLFRRNLKKVVFVVLMTLGTLALIEGFNFFFEKILKPHQQNRIKALIDPNIDPLGIGWNVTQAKIAIGSGGFWGKGFLQGTQTKYGFVPEQRTDFIFCTIGEEYGWIGVLLFISTFVGLLLRICFVAERQKRRFARSYGYSVASILFFHFLINVGMTVGLMPVIGIPLPFISYGGSALWSFSLMLFILLKLDAERHHYISWQQDPFLD